VKVRQQAADLTTRLAVVIKQCGEDQFLRKLGLVLFEQLSEEYPDTFGSIIAAEGSIANVVGMMQIDLPLKDLCALIFILPSRQLLILLPSIRLVVSASTNLQCICS
jgi:splicing factor 3B subunit 1